MWAGGAARPRQVMLIRNLVLAELAVGAAIFFVRSRAFALGPKGTNDDNSAASAVAAVQCPSQEV